MATPEELIDALKEKKNTDYIKSLLPAGGGSGGTFDDSLFMKEKGVITDIADVTETGIFYGSNITNAPVTGDMLVMASRDSQGNLGYFLMDDKMDLWLGGTPNSGQTAWSKMVKATDNLVIGDRQGEAQLTLDAKTGDAAHIIFKRNGTALSSIGAIAAANKELIIEQRANEDIRFILPTGNNIVAKIGTVFHTLMTDVTTETMIREFRKTVKQDIADHAKPTRDECIATFKKLPHFDWAKDDDYYIQDTSGDKLVLIKYRAKANSTDEASAGNFHYEVLTTAV